MRFLCLRTEDVRPLHFGGGCRELYVRPPVSVVFMSGARGSEVRRSCNCVFVVCGLMALVDLSYFFHLKIVE